MSSTNSKSYEAAIREADAAKKQANELETKILERMEAADAAEKALAERSEEFSRIQSERDERLRAFEEEARAKEAELASRGREREAIFEGLPPAAKSLYKRISARIRDGVALAEARNGSCSACFIALRPQVMAQVRRGEEIVTCDNCNRILFYQPVAKTDAKTESKTTVSAT
jgi:predicted  nucleic acid-binding Zn-ribbon protein